MLSEHSMLLREARRKSLSWNQVVSFMRILRKFEIGSWETKPKMSQTRTHCLSAQGSPITVAATLESENNILLLVIVVL